MTEEVHRLYRSRTNRMIGGVCGGLGEFFAIDPTLIRILFTILAILGGQGILLYLILVIIIPDQPQPAKETELAKEEKPE
jgi:phage shock protein C